MAGGPAGPLRTLLDVSPDYAGETQAIRADVFDVLDDSYVSVADSAAADEDTLSPDLTIVVGSTPERSEVVDDERSVPTVYCVDDPERARAIEANSDPRTTAMPWTPTRPQWEFLPAAIERVLSGVELGRYERLLGTIADGVYVLDSAGKFVQVNDSLCSLTGYSREELLGSRVELIKDSETVAEAEDALRGLLRDETARQAVLDIEILQKDGTPVPCEDRMTILRSQGEFRGTVGSLRDMSDQRHREQMLSELLSATTEMLAADSPEAIAQIVVDTAEDALGLPFSTVRYADGELVPVVSSEATKAVMPERPTYELGEGPVGTAFTEQSVLYRRVSDVEDGRDRGDLTAALYLPLGTHGTLTVGTLAQQGLSDQDQFVVQLLAQSAAAALDRIVREVELEEYEALVKSVDDMAFVVDDDDSFRLFTDPFAAFLGYGRDELEREPFDLVDDGTIEGLVTALRANDQSRSLTRAAELLDATGTKQPVRLTASPIASNEFSGIVVSVDDTSELVSAQEAVVRATTRVEQLFDTVTDPVLELKSTTEGIVVNEYNHSFARLTTAAIAGEHVSALETSLCDERLSDRIRDIVAQDRLSSDGRPDDSERDPVVVDTPNGRRDYVTRTLQADIDDRTHLFVLLTDVTDLRQRETQLAVLGRVLRHNLRNEMNVVQGFAAEIGRRSTDADIVSQANHIETASTRLLSLSETARRAQTALGSDTAYQRTHPADVIEDSVEVLGTEADDPTLSVSVDDCDDVHVSDNFAVAVAQLIENAFVHGDVPVTCSVSQSDGRVYFRVCDAGSGIPDHEWDIVTGEPDITQLRHGSGLGLWLVRWITDNHSGSLFRDTTDAGESVVGIWVPTSPAE
ncbi:sensor histidine kinase [Halobaculum limi]|uniref:sensor histidine kinase n=1 Tax=Halobaculum limi TaxID=3031916 RepID=UPI00240551C3|nr:PAS domain-containing sensor histidine kinase [Halobaculum sp. YSMS11]